MRHKWDYSQYGDKTSDMLVLGRRVCLNCGIEHVKHNRQVWMRVVGYEWSGDGRSNCPGVKKMKKTKSLKWKRADYCRQKTHCGQYWVERDPDGGHFGRWHAHRKDIDEQLTGDGFRTREEAKRYCEKDFCDAEDKTSDSSS